MSSALRPTQYDDPSVTLAEARRWLIVSRLPYFAVYWFGTTLVWEVVLVVQGLITPAPALLLLGVQLAVVVLTHVVCRADPRAPRVTAVVAAEAAVLGISSTVLFAVAHGNGEIIAFILLTLYLATAFFFAWGWRITLGLLLVTVVPWLTAISLLMFFMPTIELVAAIMVGSLVSLVLAEVSARSFAIGFLHRRREEEATRALAASRDAYRDLAENASDLIYTHDLEGRLTYVNEAFARYVEQSAAELVGQRAPDMLADHGPAPDAMAVIARVVAGETVPPVLLPVLRGGEPRWLECVVSAIRADDGRVVGVRGIARDVTERRAAEEALRASMEDLRRSEEDLRQLAQRQALIREEERKRLGFDLHDDVCQELVGIGILVESARRQIASQQPQAVTGLERVTRYLNEVVEHLRLLARDLQPMLLRDLGLEGSVRSLAEGMSSNGTRVVTEFVTRVPRLEEHVEIGVYRIVQEALANAARHAAARTIVIRLAVNGGRLSVDIRDDGCGFASDEPPHLAHLGLVGMRERAIALGGHVEVRSAPGKGTAVHLECPLAVGTPATAA